jgi:hypothetical protein
MKTHRNNIALIIFLIGYTVLNTSMSYNIDEYGILDYPDIELQENQDSPALQTPIDDEPNMETYNEWQCFPSNLAKIQCLNEDGQEFSENLEDSNEGPKFYPTISFGYENTLYKIEWIHRMSFTSCFEMVEEWKSLIAGEEGFCTFSAQWPDEPVPGEDYRIIYGLKTRRGLQLAPTSQEKFRDLEK